MDEETIIEAIAERVMCGGQHTDEDRQVVAKILRRVQPATRHYMACIRDCIEAGGSLYGCGCYEQARALLPDD